MPRSRKFGAPSVPIVEPDAYILSMSLLDLKPLLQALPGRRSPCLVFPRLQAAFPKGEVVNVLIFLDFVEKFRNNFHQHEFTKASGGTLRL